MANDEDITVSGLPKPADGDAAAAPKPADGDAAAAPKPADGDAAAAPKPADGDAAAAPKPAAGTGATGPTPAAIAAAATPAAMAEPQAERPLDPHKLLRLANLSREVLEEVRRLGQNNSTSQGLAELYGRVQQQLTEALPESLAQELESMQLDLPFKDQATADEVRVVYSGLIGWLGGLFQGLHASMMAGSPKMLEPGGPPERPGMPGEAIMKGEGYL